MRVDRFAAGILNKVDDDLVVFHFDEMARQNTTLPQSTTVAARPRIDPVPPGSR
jgi:hypothetical protein